MALIECRFESAVLAKQVAMTVVVPDSGTELPVLHLLHGRGDDNTAWTRQTGIERYAEQRGLAVVMPDAGLSYYRDAVRGPRYWSFLADELPSVCARLFPLSTRREDTFVAGLSMGGYGAVQWALRRPESFAAAASLSGQLDIAAALERRRAAGHEPDPIWAAAFGEGDVAGTDADLLHLAALRGPGAGPALWVGCGTEDPMLGASVAFVDAARAAGVQLEFETSPGTHDWDYWDREIRRVLDWLPLAR